jgi:hypothetical protein
MNMEELRDMEAYTRKVKARLQAAQRVNPIVFYALDLHRHGALSYELSYEQALELAVVELVDDRDRLCEVANRYAIKFGPEIPKVETTEELPPHEEWLRKAGLDVVRPFNAHSPGAMHAATPGAMLLSGQEVEVLRAAIEKHVYETSVDVSALSEREREVFAVKAARLGCKTTWSDA